MAASGRGAPSPPFLQPHSHLTLGRLGRWVELVQMSLFAGYGSWLAETLVG